MHMAALFEQTLAEVRREWGSFSLRQRRLIGLLVLLGLSVLLWLGIVTVLIRVL